MGRNAVFFIMGLAVISNLLNFICLFLSFHTWTFTAGIPLMKFDTYATWVGVSDVGIAHAGCKTIVKFFKNPPFECTKDYGTMSIKDLQIYLCSPGVTAALTESCEAYTYAFGFGFYMMIATIISTILEVTGGWLMWTYVHDNAKKTFRTTAQMLFIASPVNLAMAVFMYIWVIMSLDSIAVRFSLLGTTKITGLGPNPGYLLLYLVLGIKIVACVLFNNAKIGLESLLSEQKALRNYMQETEMQRAYQGGGMPAMDGYAGGAGGMNDPVYGGAPGGGGYGGAPGGGGYGGGGYGASDSGAWGGAAAPGGTNMGAVPASPPNWGSVPNSGGAPSGWGGMGASGPPHW